MLYLTSLPYEVLASNLAGDVFLRKLNIQRTILPAELSELINKNIDLWNRYLDVEKNINKYIKADVSEEKAEITLTEKYNDLDNEIKEELQSRMGVLINELSGFGVKVCFKKEIVSKLEE